MPQTELHKKIIDKTARLAVIGLGYVGLPVACEFARVGFDTLGIDRDQEKIFKVNQGTCPIASQEPELPALLREVVGTGQFKASSSYNDLSSRDVIIITVETPVDSSKQPAYEALVSALRSLGAVMQPGTLVIIESTLAPGTMDKLVHPMLSQSSGLTLNVDYYLGHCPERVMPGRLLHNLRHSNRVIGGKNFEACEMMKDFYSHVVQADLDLVDCITAELVKTVENAYRDVQIAFANEVALICETVGGDVWKVRPLVNKSPNRQMHLPGAGVGGHCIPKDPWLLASAVQPDFNPPKLIPAARQVNDSMPDHMVDLIVDALAEAGRAISGAYILVLGYAYLEESDDSRNSPSQLLVNALQKTGANSIVHDPFVPGYQIDLFQSALSCDAVIVMVAHQAYREINLARLQASLQLPVLVDGRAIYNSETLQQAGFIYRIIGQSKKSLPAINTYT